MTSTAELSSPASAHTGLTRGVTDPDYTLDHKYTRTRGRIYLSGVQALVRLPLMQRLRDQAAGLDTGGFISGYRVVEREGKPGKPPRENRSGDSAGKKKKLSYRERRELNALPDKINRLEAEQKDIYALLTDMNFYQREAAKIAGVKARLIALEKELEESYKRWEFLEN